MKFTLYQDARSEWRWCLRADNGKIVADSAEGYKNHADCYNILKKIASAIEAGEVIYEIEGQ